MAILSSIALASIRPEAFDEQIQHLRELAEMLQPDASVRSSASYFKALTALERMLLERNDVIGGLFSTTRPRGRAGILLEVSPIDLGREQRMLDHAVGMVDLPAARVIWYLDVLRELRATNLWWRTKILELALTRQQRPPQNMAAAMQAFERLTVESMLEMLPEQGDVPRVYSAPDARNHDIAMVRDFTAPRVLLNEEREQALMQALVPAPARTRARDAGGGDESQPTAAAPERSAVRTHEQSEAVANLDPIERTPHLELKAAAPLAPETEFLVEVWADTGDPRHGEQGEKLRIDAPGGIKEFYVDVSLLVTGHFEILQWPLDTLLIKRGQSISDPLAYKLRVKPVEQLLAMSDDLVTLERGYITAVFSYRGHACGRVWRVVPLDLPGGLEHRSRTADGEANREHVSKPAATITITHLSCPVADIVVDITADYENDGRSYHCKVTTALETTEQTWKVENGRTADVVIGFMENFTAPKKSPTQRIAALRGAGKSLFRAAPPNFQAAYWRLIDAKRPPRTIQVNSEEPHFLWEIMVPHRDGDESRYPLGVEHDVARWLTGTSISPRCKVDIEDSYVVAPTYFGNRALPNTPKESAFVCGAFAGIALTPQTFDQIRNSVKAKPVSLLHFACHGKSGENGTQQTLELANDTEITAAEVEGDDVLQNYLRTKHPFLFLNACEAGRSTASLRSAGGFPAVMMGAEAGAVIAPVWSVKDRVSHEVATSFYRELKENPGRPLAAILREIRRRAYDEGEDSFAAYCFFGNVHTTWQ